MKGERNVDRGVFAGIATVVLAAAVLIMMTQEPEDDAGRRGSQPLAATQDGADVRMAAGSQADDAPHSTVQRKVIANESTVEPRGADEAAAAAKPLAIVQGRLDPVRIDAREYRVQLALCNEPDLGEVPAGEHEDRLAHHYELYVDNPAAPDNQYWYEADDAVATREGNGYELHWPLRGQEWRWFRVEVRSRSGLDPDQRIPGRHMLLAASRPFRLSTGAPHIVETLVIRPPIGVEARLLTDRRAFEDSAIEWTLYLWSSERADDPGWHSAGIQEGTWPAESRLALRTAPHLAGQRVQLQARVGLLRATTPPKTLVHGANDLGLLELPKPAHILGQVLDDQTGLPVPLHEVTISDIPDEQDGGAAKSADPSQFVRLYETVESDAGNGRFESPPLAPGRYRLTTRAWIDDASAIKDEAEGRNVYISHHRLELEIELAPGEEREVALRIGTPRTRLTVTIPELPASDGIRTVSWPDREGQSIPQFHRGNPFVIEVPHGARLRFRTLPQARNDKPDWLEPYLEAEGSWGPSTAAADRLELTAAPTRVELSAPPGITSPLVILTDEGFPLSLEAEQAGYDWSRIHYVGLPDDGSPRVVRGLSKGRYVARIYSLDGLSEAAKRNEDPYANYLKMWTLEVE